MYIVTLRSYLLAATERIRPSDLRQVAENFREAVQRLYYGLKRSGGITFEITSSMDIDYHPSGSSICMYALEKKIQKT